MATLLLEAREEWQLTRLRSKLHKLDLLVLDELGYVPASPAAPTADRAARSRARFRGHPTPGDRHQHDRRRADLGRRIQHLVDQEIQARHDYEAMGGDAADPGRGRPTGNSGRTSRIP